MITRSAMHATFAVEPVYDHPSARVFKALADPAANELNRK